MKIYQVGGSIRDELIGITSDNDEIDWLVEGATPEEMERLGYKLVGKDFPVFLHPETYEEYALARTEKKSGTGYKGFEIFSDPNVTVKQDLFRRDLTINAIARDNATGKIIDPYCGMLDIKRKILRHISEHFSEDPLRVLRVARFYAKLFPYGFKVHPSTDQLIDTISNSGELDALSNERKWIEVEKALSYEYSHEFFGFLAERGLLGMIYPPWNATLYHDLNLYSPSLFHGHKNQELLKLLTMIPLSKKIFKFDLTSNFIQNLIQTYPIQKNAKTYIKIAFSLATNIYKDSIHPNEIIQLADNTKVAHNQNLIEDLKIFFHEINIEDKTIQLKSDWLIGLIINYTAALKSHIKKEDSIEKITELKINIASDLIGSTKL